MLEGVQQGPVPVGTFFIGLCFANAVKLVCTCVFALLG